MKEEIIQIQNDLYVQILGAYMYALDSYTYNCLLLLVADCANKAITNLNLSHSSLLTKLRKDYILIQTKNIVRSLDGKLSIFIEFSNSCITKIEVSVVY